MRRVIRGFVVGTIDRGEADRSVALLTVDEGLLWLNARGARRSKKRFGGALEPGHELEVEVDGARNDLANAQVLRSPDRARTSIDRLALLLYGCEWAATFAERGEPSRKLAGLFEVFVPVVDGEAEPSVATRVAYEAKVLTFSGVLGPPERCSVCGEGVEAPMVFVPEKGGGCHGHCASGPAVAVEALWALSVLRRTPLLDTPTMPEPRDPWLLGAFPRYLLGRDLRSASVLRGLGRGP